MACGLADNYCYYRGPHAGGAVFIAFSGVPAAVFAPVDVQQFVSVTTQCIQQFHLDHKTFIEGFLLWNKTQYEWEDQTLIAHFGQDLAVEFEQVETFWRIGSIRTVL